MENYRLLESKDYKEYMNLISVLKPSTCSQNFFNEFLQKLGTESEIWVLEYDKQLVACATILFEQKLLHGGSTVGHVEDVVVAKNSQGKNFGKKIISFITNRAKEKNCYKVILDCKTDLKVFYEKCGYLSNNIQMSLYFEKKK